MISTPPFYLDWTFWTATAAVLALVLSQLPPLHILFRRTAVAVQPYDRLNVTHWLGNPNVNLHVQLTNTGGRAVRIRSLSLELTRDDGVILMLPAQSFARTDGTPGALIFTGFTLKPDMEWANFLNFFSALSTSDERESKRLIKELRTDVDSKVAARTSRAKERGDVVEADAAKVEPVRVFSRAHNFWKPGEYTVRLAAACEPRKASVARQFRFTLFESDVQELEERTSQYKYGAGVYFNDPRQTEVFPRIRDLT